MLAQLVLAAAVALPPGAQPLEVRGRPGVWTSSTTWAAIEERIRAGDRYAAAADAELELQAAELRLLRATTSSAAAGLAAGVEAARALGACLAREQGAVEAADRCEAARLGPVELAAGAGGALVAGALLGGLVCWGAR